MTDDSCPAERIEISIERKRSAPAIKVFGPAIIVAAAGIGASDIIAASVAGARFGLALLWAVALGAALKGVLSEGIARWQVASGTTLLQGVAKHLPPWVLLFTAYLAVWAVGVSGALANGCGLAIENLSGGRVPRSWGAVSHVLVAAFVVRSGGLLAFTKAMKLLIIAMFITILYCAVRTAPAPHVLVPGFWFVAVRADGCRTFGPLGPGGHRWFGHTTHLQLSSAEPILINESLRFDASRHRGRLHIYGAVWNVYSPHGQPSFP
jgi:hypothetical protein